MTDQEQAQKPLSKKSRKEMEKLIVQYEKDIEEAEASIRGKRSVIRLLKATLSEG